VGKTKFVEYGHSNWRLGDLPHGFWAFDVALDVFLKHLIDAAEASGQADTPWLSDEILSWRYACVPDYGLTFETDWSEQQRQTFLALAEKACTKLAARVSIPAEEIVSWEILEGVRLYTRGDAEVLTAPVAELGRAIIALVSGELPEAPQGELWFYGLPEGRQSLKMDMQILAARGNGTGVPQPRGIFSLLSTVREFLRRFQR